jgi:hypothetical protein
MARKEVTFASNTKSFAAGLQDKCDAWKRLNEGVQKNRKLMLNAFLSGYSTSSMYSEHFINLVDRGVSTVVPYLVEGNPRILVETNITNYRPWAYTTQLALQFFINKLDLANNVFIPAAVNSMFGAGIARTHYVYDRIVTINDEPINVGSPWVDLIDDTNYIGDPSAKRRSDFAFEGDVYVLPTNYAKQLFAGKDKNGNQIADYISPDSKIVPDYSPKRLTNPNFDRSELSLRDYTTFVDVYLRDEGTIVTIMPKGKKAKILRETEYKGPGDGPYDYLGYKYAPETCYPIPPAWAWYELDKTMNVLAQKMKEQAESQKDVIAYNAEAAEDAGRIVDASNMGTVRVDNVDALKQVSFGGANPQNWDYMNWIEMQQTKQGANPDVLSGRGGQAPTLGQEQMMYNNATRIVGNFYNRYQDWMTGIVKKLAWAFWHDPTVYVPVIKEVPGAGQLPEVFADAEKVGDFYDFAFKIVPYSTQRMNPELQYQKMMQLAGQWILPTLGMAQAQGAQLDIPLATQILGDYLGVESLKQWYKTAVPSELDQVPYKMAPDGSKNKRQQGNDSNGATLGSRLANLGQQQDREGAGTDTVKQQENAAN